MLTKISLRAPKNVKISKNGPLAVCSTENSKSYLREYWKYECDSYRCSCTIEDNFTRDNFCNYLVNKCWPINLYLLTCNQKDQNMKKSFFQDEINRLFQYNFRITYKTFECCWRPFVIHKLFETITIISHISLVQMLYQSRKIKNIHMQM